MLLCEEAIGDETMPEFVREQLLQIVRTFAASNDPALRERGFFLLAVLQSELRNIVRFFANFEAFLLAGVADPNPGVCTNTCGVFCGLSQFYLEKRCSSGVLFVFKSENDRCSARLRLSCFFFARTRT